MSVSAASGAPDRSSPGRADAVTAAPPGAESPLAYLDSLANFERTGQLTSTTTSRVAVLVAELGHPERSYPVIHVTGTNGKGSTTAMIAGLLASRGARVGTYTSPHLDRLAERITISGQPVEDRELAEGVGQVAAAALRSGVTPTWFEAVTASAFWLLAARQVDAAVIEVGMLGRWDATNVVNGSVSVVTNVQLDHTDVAGPIRASIASEKADIVKPGSTLILGERDPELRPLFEAERPGRILTLGSEMSWRNRTATESGSIVDLVNPWGARGTGSASACSAVTSATTPFWRSRPLRPSAELPYLQGWSTRSCPESRCRDASRSSGTPRQSSWMAPTTRQAPQLWGRPCAKRSRDITRRFSCGEAWPAATR